jgi:hypothetical protein
MNIKGLVSTKCTQNIQTCPPPSSPTLAELLVIDCWAEEVSKSGPPP